MGSREGREKDRSAGSKEIDEVEERTAALRR
jgi:hypothetical protein